MKCPHTIMCLALGPQVREVRGGYGPFRIQSRGKKGVLKIVATTGTNVSPLLPVCCSDVSSHITTSCLLQ